MKICKKFFAFLILLPLVFAHQGYAASENELPSEDNLESTSCSPAQWNYLVSRQGEELSGLASYLSRFSEDDYKQQLKWLEDSNIDLRNIPLALYTPVELHGKQQELINKLLQGDNSTTDVNTCNGLQENRSFIRTDRRLSLRQYVNEWRINSVSAYPSNNSLLLATVRINPALKKVKGGSVPKDILIEIPLDYKKEQWVKGGVVQEGGEQETGQLADNEADTVADIVPVAEDRWASTYIPTAQKRNWLNMALGWNNAIYRAKNTSESDSISSELVSSSSYNLTFSGHRDVSPGFWAAGSLGLFSASFHQVDDTDRIAVLDNENHLHVIPLFGVGVGASIIPERWDIEFSLNRVGSFFITREDDASAKIHPVTTLEYSMQQRVHMVLTNRFALTLGGEISSLQDSKVTGSSSDNPYRIKGISSYRAFTSVAMYIKPHQSYVHFSLGYGVRKWEIVDNNELQLSDQQNDVVFDIDVSYSYGF